MSDQDYFLRYAWCYVSAVYVTFIMYIYRTSGTLALISVNADYNDRYCCYTKTFHSISHSPYIDHVTVLKNFGECTLLPPMLEYLFPLTKSSLYHQIHSAYTCRLTRSIFPWLGSLGFFFFYKYNLCLFQYFSFNRFDVSLRRKGAQFKDNDISIYIYMHCLCPEKIINKFRALSYDRPVYMFP